MVRPGAVPPFAPDLPADTAPLELAPALAAALRIRLLDAGGADT